MNLTAYRPVAIEACKHLIITGNAIIRRMDDGKRVLYGIKRHVIERDQKGNEKLVILFDKKFFGSFSDDKKKLITEGVGKEFKDDDELELYTGYKRKGKRWQVHQEVLGIQVGKPFFLNERDYDLICMNWNLASGEHYGRGLVEDEATIFHKLDVTGAAVTGMMAAIADIKFFVRPSSPLVQQLDDLRERPTGSYFVGSEGDITVPDVGKGRDLNTMLQQIQYWEQVLSTSFLLSSVRDAERVTAEEIRLVAKELESSFGGLYSKLAIVWQDAEARYAISQVDLAKELGSDLFKTFEIVISTGLESLSKAGTLDAVRFAIQDMQMLDAVPEDIRGTINPLRFAKFIFAQHSIDLNAFLNTEEEIQAQQQAAQQQEQQMMVAQSQANVAEEAGKQQVQAQ